MPTIRRIRLRTIPASPVLGHSDVSSDSKEERTEPSAGTGPLVQTVSDDRSFRPRSENVVSASGRPNEVPHRD